MAAKSDDIPTKLIKELFFAKLLSNNFNTWLDTGSFAEVC